LKVAILHQTVLDNAAIDASDVLDEAEFVDAGLKAGGHHTIVIPNASLDLGETIASIRKYRPDVIFNLVEDIAGSNILNPIGAMICEHLQVPFTGSPSSTLSVTTDKVLCKKIMKEAVLPTAKMVTYKDMDNIKSGRYIVKPIYEDGSVGISDGCVMDARDLFLHFAALGTKAPYYFAEEFIDGRELFVPLVYSIDRKEMVALSPAEFVYDGYPDDKPKILNYTSKWNKNSFEDVHTIKTYEFSREDKSMIEYLQFIAERCAKLFNLHGYARIDFRIAKEGNPFAILGNACILEVNANPHLDPDSIMFDSAKLAGMTHADFMNAILADAVGGQ
jgi:D-alanine-D-alanine ligase